MTDYSNENHRDLLILHAMSGGLGMYFSHGLMVDAEDEKVEISFLEILKQFEDFDAFSEVLDLEAEQCDLLLLGLLSDDKFKLQFKNQNSRKFVKEVVLATDVSSLMKVEANDALLLPSNSTEVHSEDDDNVFLSISFQGFPFLDFHR